MRLFKKLDEKGVSPVIGVILMVAITVILAAVIASFVFGMGSKMTQKTPQVMFSARITSGNLTLTDLGGDKVSLNDLQIFLTDQAGNVYPSTGPMLLSGNATTIPSGISTLGAGDKVLISLSRLGISPGTYTVTLLYKPTNSVIWSGSVTY